MAGKGPDPERFVLNCVPSVGTETDWGGIVT
jgi:hypothetical protein